MSTDFEKDLREQMLASGDHTGIDLDLDSVLDDGHRAVRQQTVRRAGVAGALAGLLAIGGVAAVQAGRPVSVPAAPMTGTPSQGQSSWAVVGSGQTTGIETPQWLLVRLESVAADGTIRWSVGAASTVAAGQVPHTNTPGAGQRQEFVLPAGKASMLVQPSVVCRYCQVGVVRGAVTLTQVVTREATSSDRWLGEAGSGTDQLGGGAMTVSAWWQAPQDNEKPSSTQASAARGLQWRGADGQWANDGGPLLQASLRVGDTRRVVYHDVTYDTFGIADDSGTGSTGSADTTRLMPMRTADGGGLTTGAGLLPAGSTITSIRWTKGQGVGWSQATLQDGSVAYLAVAKAQKGATMAEPASLTYRTAQGKVVTQRG